MAKILLFGVSTQKDRAVRVAAEKIGVDVTAVNRRDYGQKIGTLAEWVKDCDTDRVAGRDRAPGEG